MPIRIAKACRFRRSSRWTPKSAKAKKAAKLVAEFYKAALPIIAKKKPANGFLMRGIAHQPEIPTLRGALRAASRRASRFIRCTRAWRSWSA